MAAALILRTVKGSPLTNIEVDNNFSNLNTWGNTINSNVGVLSNLTTSANGNIVVAINELVTSNSTSNVLITALRTNVGIISNLTTSNKDNLVAAINEIALESTANVTITGGTITGVVITNSTYNANTIEIAYGGTGQTNR